jgi:hypothetical protein
MYQVLFRLKMNNNMLIYQPTQQLPNKQISVLVVVPVLVEQYFSST